MTKFTHFTHDNYAGYGYNLAHEAATDSVAVFYDTGGMEMPAWAYGKRVLGRFSKEPSLTQIDAAMSLLKSNGWM